MGPNVSRKLIFSRCVLLVAFPKDSLLALFVVLFQASTVKLSGLLPTDCLLEPRANPETGRAGYQGGLIAACHATRSFSLCQLVKG